MCILSSEETLLPPCEETLILIQAKPSSAPEDVNIQTSSPQHLEHALTVSDEHVFASIDTMPTASAAGLDGMRPIFLMQLTSQELDEDGRRLLRATTKLVNLILKGKVPEFARGGIFGVSLVAFKKP